MLYVLCRDRAPDHHPGFEAEAPGLRLRAEPVRGAPDSAAGGLAFQPQMVLSVSPSRDARTHGYDLAEELARVYRGVVWSEDTGEEVDPLGEASSAGPSASPRLASFVARWREHVTPAIERAREEARAKQAKLEESRARAQAGERVEQLDWRIDFDDDEADARAAEEVRARIAADRARAEAALPVDDPDDLRAWLCSSTPTLRASLESAILDAVARTHHEVTVPHWLLAILASGEGDARVVCDLTGVTAASIRARLERLLAHRRSGAVKPTFGAGITPLIRSAWSVVHTDAGETRVRTGHVLWTALRGPPTGQALGWWRYPLLEERPRGVSTDAVRRALTNAIHPEAREARG